MLPVHSSENLASGLGARPEQSPRPVLSVAMPTRNRPVLFERALASVIEAAASVADKVEITVSDGSDDDTTRKVVQRLLETWSGRHRYVWNRPPLSQVDNWNRAIELTTGAWIQQLHDDDFLLPRAARTMLETIQHAEPKERVMLFGARIVGLDGVATREQAFRRDRYLEPSHALQQLLCNSSFVRQPALVVHRSCFEHAGLFDASVGEATDTEMWLRLFSRFGVRCVPQTICAYTIHEGAISDGMWNPRTIRAVQEIFDRAVALELVPEATIRRWQSDFFHQFILAGVYRRLRGWKIAEGRRVLGLFDLPEVRRVGVSPRWLLLRVAFIAATAGVSRNE